MANGYIKLHRKMTDWEWYRDPNTFRVFVHLLLSAQYKETEFRGHTIKPGQVVCGRKQLAEELGVGEQTIRTALNRLKSTNEITIKVTNKFSIITIEKWAKYQCLGAEANQQTNQQPNQQLTSKTKKSNHIQEFKESKEIERVPRAPTFEEVSEYVKERGYEMDPEAFFDYYQETDWHKKNGQPIKDWKASVRTWARREKEFRKNATEGNGSRPVIEPPKYKEFGPEPKIDAVEMPDDIRRAVNKILKEA